MLGICENSIAGKTAFVTAAPLLDNQPLFPDVFPMMMLATVFLVYQHGALFLTKRHKFPAKRKCLLLFLSVSPFDKVAVFFSWTRFGSKTTVASMALVTSVKYVCNVFFAK